MRISTHAPLAGRDTWKIRCLAILQIFQPTRPLRGATRTNALIISHGKHFNPRAPCGARPFHPYAAPAGLHDFNPRAPCGARRGIAAFDAQIHEISTHAPLAGRDAFFDVAVDRRHNFNPRAPCGARPLLYAYQYTLEGISTHAPLAGRDATHPISTSIYLYFNPRAPCGARPLFPSIHVANVHISTHAPLAGRDSKSVQITMHIFAITDKFQMLLHRMPPVRAFCSFLMQENHADFGCEPPK